MGFKCGIIGLPNVGKSTIFNALTAQQVPASNYPFCTVDPNHGIVPLEDPRLDRIQEIFHSKKKVPTHLEFVDIAGLVKGASKGEGLGNQFLSHIQQVDALAHVVRCFEDPDVAHIDAELDPVRDAEIVDLELVMKDLETVEKQVETLRRRAKVGDRQVLKELEVLERVRKNLDEGIPVRKMSLDAGEREILRPLNLLSAKPVLYIANVDEAHMSDSEDAEKLRQYAQAHGAGFLQLCGKAQAEIAQLDPESQEEFLRELGLDESGLQKLVRAGYQLLDLITFFTANENEAHAWTVRRGTDVVKAAGKIHSDFERGFIRAEVMKFTDLDRLGSEHALREQGLVAVHGRDYIVEDGDVILYRFKV
ncbi:MAG TPA: redox-regulated ATPase YchF [Bacteroidetes bacterium]|nr:redox-regulated ATPase YchF [Bacteroidota bacterium]